MDSTNKNETHTQEPKILSDDFEPFPITLLT